MPSPFCGVMKEMQWPELFKRESAEGEVAVAAVPLPADADGDFLDSLISVELAIDGRQVQVQTVARWPGGKPRRLLVRWIGHGPRS